MSKATDTPAKARAPAVREKLNAAEHALQILTHQIAQASLDEVEDVAGAQDRMRSLSAEIGGARATVAKLRAALTLAEHLDSKADLMARSKIRASQMAAFSTHMREREAAVADLCEAAGKMAEAYQRYSQSTLKAAGVRPIGTSLPVMAMGPNGACGNAMGSLDLLLAAELYRCSTVDNDGMRYPVPLAKQMSLFASHTDSIPTAFSMFQEAQAAIMAEVKGQCTRIDAGEAAAIAKAAPQISRELTDAVA